MLLFFNILKEEPVYLTKTDQEFNQESDSYYHQRTSPYDYSSFDEHHSNEEEQGDQVYYSRNQHNYRGYERRGLDRAPYWRMDQRTR